MEGMLNDYIDDFGITMSQLMEACSTGLAKKYKVYVHILYVYRYVHVPNNVLNT